MERWCEVLACAAAGSVVLMVVASVLALRGEVSGALLAGGVGASVGAVAAWGYVVATLFEMRRRECR